MLQERLDQPFYVWGEDALLKWPGALAPLIDERDAFMARVVAAAAKGANPNVPAYVADEVGAAAQEATSTKLKPVAQTAYLKIGAAMLHINT